jgi:hypothetical protein
VKLQKVTIALVVPTTQYVQDLTHRLQNKTKHIEIMLMLGIEPRIFSVFNSNFVAM